MTDTEIDDLFIKEVLPKLKAQGSKIFKSGKSRLPDYNPIYVKTVELMRRIQIHSELDSKPIELMKKRAPFEDDRQFKYREDNFNNITMPYFMEAVGKLNRIMNPSNYSIQWKAEQEDEKKYFEKSIPVFKSIEAFFEQVVLVEKILDPNALLVVKPRQVPTKFVSDDSGDLIEVADQTQNIETIPVVYSCENVILYKEDEHALVLTDDKSFVEFNGKRVKEGLIFEFYDRYAIHQIRQTGKKVDYTFETFLYYTHEMGVLPVQKLKGIPKAKGDNIYYQSYFIYAVPHLDDALYENSTLSTSITAHLFPQKVEYVDKCSECDGAGYRNDMMVEGEQLRESCITCKGTGTLTRTGPLLTKQFVMPDANTLSPSTAAPFPGSAYVSPPTEPLDFLYRKIQDGVYAAFGFMNTDRSNSAVKGTDTALGKQIDREELFSFLMRISNEIFDLMRFTIEMMGKIRYGEDFDTPVVSAPTSFSIRSEYDLTEEMTEGKKAGLPDIAFREIVREYIAKRFSNTKNVDGIVSLVFRVDRLITSNTIDINIKLSSGICAKWEAILHDSIYTFIEDVMAEDGDFLTKDLSIQKQTLVDKAKQLEKEITPVTGKTDTILEIANA